MAQFRVDAFINRGSKIATLSCDDDLNHGAILKAQSTGGQSRKLFIDWSSGEKWRSRFCDFEHRQYFHQQLIDLLQLLADFRPEKLDTTFFSKHLIICCRSTIFSSQLCKPVLIWLRGPSFLWNVSHYVYMNKYSLIGIQNLNTL